MFNLAATRSWHKVFSVPFKIYRNLNSRVCGSANRYNRIFMLFRVVLDCDKFFKRPIYINFGKNLGKNLNF